MKNGSLIFVIVFLLIGIPLFLFFNKGEKGLLVSPLSQIKEKPLEKYEFERLKKTQFSGSPITFGKMLKDGQASLPARQGFVSYVFYFTVFGKQVSGFANIPKNAGTYPVIVMLRGYVDKEKYSIGEGTRKGGEVFAQNGFITLAPDFLGYGESASPSANSIEERFQTYTTALTLLASIGNINKSLEKDEFNARADTQKIGIWGHSNGGHIALSVLELSGKAYPTVLWNPVSKPFPYSILYYTDEFDDRGKALRKAVAEFEKDYDVEKYSPLNFYDLIKAPIQLNQAGDDEAVPKKWSDQLEADLKKLEKDVQYFVYPGEDHNFSKGEWQTVVNRNIEFYKKHFRE